MSSTIENESKAKISSATSDDVWIAFAEKAGKTSQEPVRHPTMDHTPDARIYNKQIINNQFSNELSSLHVNPVSVCRPFNVWANQNSAQETYTLVPTALAKAYQQLIPLAKSLQNGNLPISYNAQQEQPTRKISRSARRHSSNWFKPRNRCVQNQSTQKRFPHTHQSPDLRAKLVRRRSFSATYSEAQQEGYNNKQSRPWNDKSHRDNEEWKETSIKMNLAPLKLLTSSGSESDQWYIVVDTDVILNNYNYLNNMATADPDCHLLIPHHVLSELHSLASESRNVQARRIFRFLNEQIQCGLAMLGEEIASEGPVDLALMTCVKLSTESNHVIFITSNPDILKFKSNTNYIHVLTIQDVKDILANKSARRFRKDSPTLALKITVPNDVAEKNFEKSDGEFTRFFKEEEDTTFGSTFDSTGYSDERMCTQKVSGFPEHFEPELHQTPPKLVSEDSTAATSSFMRAHSTENVASLSQSPLNPMLIHEDFDRYDEFDTTMPRAHSFENLKNVCSQNSFKPWISQQDQADTYVGDRNAMTHSVDNFENVCSFSPPTTGMHQDLANTDIGNKNAMTLSVEQFKTVCSETKSRMMHQDHANMDVGMRNVMKRSLCSQSPSKTRINHQEPTNTDIGDRNAMTRSMDNFITVCSQSPPKSRIMHQDHANMDVGMRNVMTRSPCSQSSPKTRINHQEPTNTDIGDKNAMTLSVEQFKTVCSETKSRMMHQDHANMDVGMRNVMTRSLCSQSPSKTRKNHQEPTNTDIGDRNAMTRSMDNFKTVCSQSPPKSRIMHQDHANMDVGMRNVMTRSPCSQSSPKTRINHQEPTNTDIGDKNAMTRSVEQFKTVCSQTKSRMMCQDHANMDVGMRNVMTRSLCSQSPSKTRINHQEPTNTDIGDRNAMTRSMDNFKTVCSQSPPKSRIMHQDHANMDVGMRNVMTRSPCSQSSPKTRINHQEPTNTDIGDRNAMTRSMDNFITVCSQSPPKSRIMHQDHANMDVGMRNVMTRSPCSQSSPKTRINHQEPTNTVCSQITPNQQYTKPHEELTNTNVTRIHPEQNCIAYSPSKTVSSFDYISSIASSNNGLGVDHNQSPSKSINQRSYEYSRHKSVAQSLLKADDVSLSSSSASSGHVSLDTLRMTRIISMKRLTGAGIMQAKRMTSNSSKITKKSPEVIQQIVNRDITASRSSYDNDSETSRTKNIAPNITVEETSLSAISNSESSYSEKAKSSFKKVMKKVSLRSVQMFSVGCQTMEDVLKSRCDEWVFRFVQIMEEVLRVKLQEKLAADNKEYPAPRDLQEAARSVIKKFSNNFSVVEAANKLSFILYKTSDEDGKIAVNIQPSDYMEMYSYGVFLVETFQDMSADCIEKNCKKEGIIKPKEHQTDSCSCYEVKTASDSLKKLLYDIQNSNLESFMDHPRDLSAENINPENDEYDYEFDATEDFQEPEDTEYYDHHSPIQQEERSEQVANFNLRSQKRKSQCFEDEEVPPKVPMSGKGYESPYFNSLHLQRTVVFPDNMEGNSHVKDININKEIVDNQKEHTAENKTSDKLQKGAFNNIQIHFSKDLNNAKLQSKVVCNFTVNADIEKKVKARQNEAEYEDYSQNEEITKTNEKFAENEEVERIEKNGESNKKYTGFIGSFIRRLGEMFSQVKLLCDDYVKINDLTDITTKKELRNKMEMAYLIMGNVYEYLDRICNRDSQNNGKNIQKLLEIAKVKDCISDDKFCIEYRYMIKKCKETSEEFLNIIRSLLKMVRV